MSKKTLEAVVIGLCVALVIGGIVAGGYCYDRGNNHGHDGNEMETFGQYAGLCFDAAIFGVLAAVRFALRRRSGWSSADAPFFFGGLLMLVVVGPIPSFLLGQTLENDAQGFLLVASLVCILLAMVGATMVVTAITEAIASLHIRSRQENPCPNCQCPVADGSKTCWNCGAHLK